MRQLDRRLLLEGRRYEAAVAGVVTRFMVSGVREAHHAGSAGYPAEPDVLRMALAAVLRGGDLQAQSADGELRGLVAPHIDLERGRAGYRAAYGELMQRGPADLYVVFGTGHAGPSRPLTGLGLDWRTPLGLSRTDRAFVDAVHRHTGAPQPADLLIHRVEHSIEFQVLWLQHVHQQHFADRPFLVAGFLCGALPSASGDPLEEPWLQELLAAIRSAEAATDGRVCYVAGADLAHVGPEFGDDDAVTDGRLDQLGQFERDRLGALERGEPGLFHSAVVGAGNPDRVCSAPAITLCAALAGGPGHLLHYGQARAPDDRQAVSFCAMSFVRPSG